MKAATSTAPESAAPGLSDRAVMRARLAESQFDLVVVGGGATGLGIALDAVLRGLSVVLLEAHDFAKGTSSRATKLVHGGVRYLAQGQIGLVRESLRERSALLHNAPGVVTPLAFVVPAYRTWEIPFYAAGLAIYDVLAGKDGLGATRVLSRKQVEERLPGVLPTGLKGGVEYWDAQFDDARLAITLARAAAAHGAVILNYCPVTELRYSGGKVVGVAAKDTETGAALVFQARCVVNATGVWTDSLRGLDADATQRPKTTLIRASRGTHLVVDKAFFPSERALLVPRTADGRVLFVVPWLGKVLLGTTDVASAALQIEPQPDEQEIDYILSEASRYLQTPPARRDIRSAWAGLRPLVDPAPANGRCGHQVATRRISREHTIEVSPSGLVSVAGGKWTTYRAMAQDVLDTCFNKGLLPMPAPCVTQSFALEEAAGPRWCGIASEPPVLAQDDEVILHKAGLSEAMIRFAAKHEYARKVEDVLARRSRVLFLSAAMAIEAAPVAARILQSETGVSADLDAFLQLARQYDVGKTQR